MSEEHKDMILGFAMVAVALLGLVTAVVFARLFAIGGSNVFP